VNRLSTRATALARAAAAQAAAKNAAGAVQLPVRPARLLKPWAVRL
jgi:hypothetical protein